MARTEQMPRRELGKTGEQVSIIGLGGFHLGKPTEREAVAIIHAALDAGLNFLDNSWDYHAGMSEERMGAALAGARRDEAFLMTKVDGRTKESATQQLDESLKRLKTDHVDLWQFHEVIRFEDADLLFDRGGIEAAAEAQTAGKVRYIGFTGHKDPDVHLHMLEVATRNGFRFDAVQLPLNALDAHYRSFEAHVLPVLEQEGIGIIGMKPMAAGRIPESGVISSHDCLRYSLSLPTDVVVTGCESMEQLRVALEIATDFEPLSSAETAELLRRTAPLAQFGEQERYKTSNAHDATAAHPEWLGVVDAS